MIGHTLFNYTHAAVLQWKLPQKKSVTGLELKRCPTHTDEDRAVN